MNQSLILVFILLATLSVINALPLVKRETQWQVCTDPSGSYPLVDVHITPDPPVEGQTDSFTVSGKFKVDVGDTLVVAFFQDLSTPAISTTATPICGAPGLPDCPQNPFTISNFQVDVPTGLPDPYFVAAIVGNPAGSGTVYGCAVAQIGGQSEASYPIASYPIASYLS